MLSLSKIALETRLIVKWGGISVGVLILLFILFQIGLTAKKVFFPKPPEPPTVSFGKLPKIVFPKTVSTQTFKYELDTTTGLLPELPDRLKVFKIEKEEPDLLAVEKAHEKIYRIGFYSKGVQVDSRIFSWKDENSPIGRTLNYDIFSRNFTLRSNYQNDPQVLSANGLFEEKVAIDTAIDLVNSIVLETKEEEGIDFSIGKTNLYSIRNGTLFPATSISSTQIVEVFLLHKNLDEIPVLYPHPKKSTMRFLVAGGISGTQIVEADFLYQRIASNSATYPIKTADEMFKELQKGKGYISSYDGKDTSIKVKNIYSAYYMGEKEQDYLLPIVVFEGNDNFYAYIPAVKDEWLNN